MRPCILSFMGKRVSRRAERDGMSEAIKKAVAAATKELLENVDGFAHSATDGRPVLDGAVDVEALVYVVIEALRDPTKEMIAAGVDADIPGGEWGSDAFRESSVDES